MSLAKSLFVVFGILIQMGDLQIQCWRCIGDFFSDCFKMEKSQMEKTSCENGVCYTGIQDDGLIIRNCYPETKAATFCQKVVKLGLECAACASNYCNTQKVKNGKLTN